MPNVKRLLSLACVLAAILYCGDSASATTYNYTNNARVTQALRPGWSGSISVNYALSNVVWTYNNSTHSMTVSYYLSGATPGFQYAAGMSFFNCNGTMPSFGQYRAMQWGCGANTWQGVTAFFQTIDVGVIQIDNNGNGRLDVTIEGILPTTYNTVANKYNIGFYVRVGVGCIEANQNVGGECLAALESGNIFGDNYAVTVK